MSTSAEVGCEMPHDSRYVVMRCIGGGSKEPMVTGDSPEEVYRKLGEQIGALEVPDDGEETDIFGFGSPDDDDLLGGF